MRLALEPTRPEARRIVVGTCLFWGAGGAVAISTAWALASMVVGLPAGVVSIVTALRVAERESGVQLVGWRWPSAKEWVRGLGVNMQVNLRMLDPRWWWLTATATAWPPIVVSLLLFAALVAGFSGLILPARSLS